MSLPLLDDALWGFVCLGLPPAGVTSAGVFLCALRAHTVWRGESGALPRRAPSWLAGPRVPCFASPARYARAPPRRSGLWESGVPLRGAFLSATAVGVRERAVAMLRVLLRSLSALAVGRSLSLPAVLSLGACGALALLSPCFSTAARLAPSRPQAGRHRSGDPLSLPRIPKASALLLFWGCATASGERLSLCPCAEAGAFKG